MKQKFFRAKEINDKLGVIAEGFTPVTRYGYVQQKYARIIRPTSLSHGGTIMTYEQSVQFMKKYTPNSDIWTYEEYKQEVKDFISEYGDRLSLQGEQQYQFDRMKNMLEDFTEFTGIDISQIPMDKMIDFVREASKRQQEEGRGSKGYDSRDRFYSHLEDILQENETDIDDIEW